MSAEAAQSAANPPEGNSEHWPRLTTVRPTGRWTSNARRRSMRGGAAGAGQDACTGGTWTERQKAGGGYQQKGMPRREIGLLAGKREGKLLGGAGEPLTGFWISA